jgi:hypothetical protein
MRRKLLLYEEAEAARGVFVAADVNGADKTFFAK